MTVQEIFNSTAVRSVEELILDLYHETERKHWCNDENKKAIKSLLEVRRRILNSMFVLDEQNKQLLAEFNEAMKQQLIEMRKRAIDLYNSVYKPDMGGTVEVEGKCFMGYEYSKIHPVQSMRAKKMWAILNGSLDDYIFLYCEDGVNSFYINNYDPKIESENELLYLNEELDNWNEGLDREMTKDMHLTYAFHNLFSHLDFSIYDLLWVRDFNIEIHVEYDYHTYKNDDYGDDLHWDKCDYYDKKCDMTYKELLDSVSFEEIVPFIEKYHGGKGCLVLYKIHYDMLRHLTPNPEDAYYKTATVSHGEQDEDWPEPHLTVHPIEGQIWEGALTMELVIEPDVNEPLAEIAACCLWHTSFYGFTEEQTKAKFESWERHISDEEYQCQQAQKWVKIVKDAGGIVPTEKELMAVPSFRDKVKASKVPVMQEYWKRIGITAEFVANNLPAESDIVGISVADLCRLFFANHYIEYDYRSYCKDENNRADYLIELIDRYEAFEYGILPNVLIVLSTSKKYPLLMEELRVAEHIAEMSKGVIRFVVKTDDTLEQELRMNIAFYKYEEKKTEPYRKLESQK